MLDPNADPQAIADSITTTEQIAELNREAKELGYPKWVFDVVHKIWLRGSEGRKLLLCDDGVDLTSNLFPWHMVKSKEERT